MMSRLQCIRRGGAAAAFVLCWLGAGTARAAAPGPSSDPATSDAHPHELYFASAFALYSSEARVLAGIGGGPGYRLALTRAFFVYADAKWLLYVGNAFTGSVGLGYRIRLRWWEPMIALQGSAFAGDSLRVISAASPAPIPPWAFAGQLRLSLLRFGTARATGAALGLDFGFGPDAGSLGTAIGITVAEAGIRF
jgi:hypothetical protein